MLNYGQQDTLAAAGTQQRLVLGSELTTFSEPVAYLTITYVDKDTYIAPTSALVAAAATGDKGSRIFVKAGTIGLTIPWMFSDVWFLNAQVGETPFIAVVGHRG